jgi:Tfp pilus assembly pilus retraction ATPase PilT
MLATDAVRALIRKGDDHRLRSSLSVGKADGTMTMEQSLVERVRAGRSIGKRRTHIATGRTISRGVAGAG